MYDYISWGDTDSLINTLYTQIKESKIEYTKIYGISRGGLIPAVSLSHRLELPLIDKLSIPDRSILIVDDIADSGKTLSQFMYHNHIAVLFCRQHTSTVIPKYIGKNITHSKWIVFPWETSESSKYDN